LFTASRFFFVYACCLIFDYRDREDDRAAGIVSMITLLNEKGIDRLFYGSMILFFLTSAALSYYHYPAFLYCAAPDPRRSGDSDIQGGQTKFFR
jgi:4-hydroxybenzoate polyprenyltransferase